MSSTSPVTDDPQQIGFKDLRALTELLIRENGLHEGAFELSVKFNITVATFSTAANRPPEPGTLNTLAGLALSPCQPDAPTAVNAAVVNPAPAKPKRRKG